MKILLKAPAVVITLALFATGPIQVFAQSTPPSYSIASFEQSVIALTNADRASHAEGDVSENALLDAAAQAKANDMMEKQYFAHVSPAGVAPWHWFSAEGYTYAYAGENLAMDFYQPSAVEAAWMASPSHRANILNAKYKNIGIGIVQGTYQGQPAIFIVEFFGAKK